MTKQKTKIVSKYPLKRRTTFKRHKKHYAKVYAPYLPAIIGLVVGLSLLLPTKFPAVRSVLSYGTSTSSGGLLDETNKQRAADGLGGLKLNGLLGTAAQVKADDMADRNYWSHDTPDGKEPWYFISQANYRYSEASENLAYGFSSSKDTINGWMNSLEHKKAMLNKDYSDVGFGIANAPNYQGQGPETIVVAMYAKPQKPGQPKVTAVLGDSSGNGVSFGQLLTRGNLVWVNIILGAGIGIIALYLVTKHSFRLRRKIRRGEQYILKHPAVDITLLSLLVLMVALSKTAGFIH